MRINKLNSVNVTFHEDGESFTYNDVIYAWDNINSLPKQFYKDVDSKEFHLVFLDHFVRWRRRQNELFCKQINPTPDGE